MYTNNPIKPCNTRTTTRRTRYIWPTTIKEDPELGPYIELPPELLKTLKWTEGAQVLWTETEICGDTGEHRGLVLEKVADAANLEGGKDK
jgi:hypothetical protein